MSTGGTKPEGSVRFEGLKQGKLYVRADAHEGHSAYVVNGSMVLNQEGKEVSSDNSWYMELNKIEAEKLAERLQTSAEHKSTLANFLRTNLPE